MKNKAAPFAVLLAALAVSAPMRDDAHAQRNADVSAGASHEFFGSSIDSFMNHPRMPIPFRNAIGYLLDDRIDPSKLPDILAASITDTTVDPSADDSIHGFVQAAKAGPLEQEQAGKLLDIVRAVLTSDFLKSSSLSDPDRKDLIRHGRSVAQGAAEIFSPGDGARLMDDIEGMIKPWLASANAEPIMPDAIGADQAFDNGAKKIYPKLDRCRRPGGDDKTSSAKKVPPLFPPKPSAADYYERIGVAPQATAEEIRSAYLKAVKHYHPDKNIGKDPAAIKKMGEDLTLINEAYETLEDPKKRAEYNFRRAKENSQISSHRSGPGGASNGAEGRYVTFFPGGVNVWIHTPWNLARADKAYRAGHNTGFNAGADSARKTEAPPPGENLNRAKAAYEAWSKKQYEDETYHPYIAGYNAGVDAAINVWIRNNMANAARRAGL